MEDDRLGWVGCMVQILRRYVGWECILMNFVVDSFWFFLASGVNRRWERYDDDDVWEF